MTNMIRREGRDVAYMMWRARRELRFAVGSDWRRNVARACVVLAAAAVAVPIVLVLARAAGCFLAHVIGG